MPDIIFWFFFDLVVFNQDTYLICSLLFTKRFFWSYTWKRVRYNYQNVKSIKLGQPVNKNVNLEQPVDSSDQWLMDHNIFLSCCSTGWFWKSTSWFQLSMFDISTSIFNFIDQKLSEGFRLQYLALFEFFVYTSDKDFILCENWIEIQSLYFLRWKEVSMYIYLAQLYFECGLMENFLNQKIYFLHIDFVNFLVCSVLNTLTL